MIPLVESCPNSILIYSGRENPYSQRAICIDGETREVRGFVEKLKSHRPFSIDMTVFEETEIREYLTAELSEASTEERVSFVREFSRGIPFAVDLLTNAIQALGLDQFMEKFNTDKFKAEVSGGISRNEIIGKITRRILYYCFQGTESQNELNQIYTLAVLNDVNPELLRQLGFGEQPEKTLRQLQSHYAFFTGTGRLHDVVREFVTDYLFSDPVLREKINREVMQIALPFYQNLYEQECEAEPIWADRFRETRWRQATANFLNALVWVDPDKGAQFLMERMLELFFFAQDFSENLFNIFDKLTKQLGLVRNRLLHQLEQLEFLTRRSNWQQIIENKDSELGTKMIKIGETLLTYWDSKSLFYQLLLLIQGPIFYLQKNFQAVWEKSSSCNPNFFEKSMQRGFAFLLNQLGNAFKKLKQIPHAIAAYKTAISLDDSFAMNY